MKLSLNKFMMVDLELIGGSLSGDVVELYGEYVGKYGSRIVAKTHNGRYHAFELSCGRLGAFDRDVKNDPDADFRTYDMNWNHMIEAALEQPFKWEVIPYGR